VAKYGNPLPATLVVFSGILSSEGGMSQAASPQLTPLGASYKPRAIMCLHGIRTHAAWQRLAAEVFADNKIKLRLYNFGRYGLHKFLLKWVNDKWPDRFYRYYWSAINDKNLRVDINNIGKRPSVVAHSFGTYILGYCMLRRKEVRFDKVILCGSILPVDFPWKTLLERGQINFVRNEYGTKDFWARTVGKFVPKTGPSGSKPFLYNGPRMEQERFEDFKHSDYFEQGHIESNWMPFFRRSPFLAVPTTVKHGRMLKDNESYTKFLLQTREIDKAIYPDLPEEDKIPWGLSLKWISREKDIYTFLIDEQQAVKGYLNAIPVEDAFFQEIKQKGANDGEFPEDKIRAFSGSKPLKIYLMSIGISPDARHPKCLEVLINGFVEKIAGYANDAVRVSEFVAVAWSKEGQKLCRVLGMEPTGTHYKDKVGELHQIYWLSLQKELSPQQKSIPAVRRLRELLVSSAGSL
jgi:pimeloyl-ACP methyl ester carboxylesterase